MAFTIDVLLERAELSLTELAERSRLDLQRVEAIVQGRWLASPTEREKLAAALGVDVAEVDWGHFMNPRNVRYHRFGLVDDFQKEKD